MQITCLYSTKDLIILFIFLNNVNVTEEKETKSTYSLLFSQLNVSYVIEVEEWKKMR